MGIGNVLFVSLWPSEVETGVSDPTTLSTLMDGWCNSEQQQ